MDADAAKELEELREQNARLKRLLAEAELEKDALREVGWKLREDLTLRLSRADAHGGPRTYSQATVGHPTSDRGAAPTAQKPTGAAESSWKRDMQSGSTTKPEVFVSNAPA